MADVVAKSGADVIRAQIPSRVTRPFVRSKKAKIRNLYSTASTHERRNHDAKQMKACKF